MGVKVSLTGGHSAVGGDDHQRVALSNSVRCSLAVTTVWLRCVRGERQLIVLLNGSDSAVGVPETCLEVLPGFMHVAHRSHLRMSSSRQQGVCLARN